MVALSRSAFNYCGPVRTDRTANDVRAIAEAVRDVAALNPQETGRETLLASVTRLSDGLGG